MSNICITLYKFTGAGNDFVVIDGRKGGVDEFRTVERIVELCREYKTDGLMILTTAPKAEISGTSPKMTEKVSLRIPCTLSLMPWCHMTLLMLVSFRRHVHPGSPSSRCRML